MSRLECSAEKGGRPIVSACGPPADIRLIVAGGWDPKVAENVEYLEDLKRLTRDAGLKSCVMFMPSISAEVWYT